MLPIWSPRGLIRTPWKTFRQSSLRQSHRAVAGATSATYTQLFLLLYRRWRRKGPISIDWSLSGWRKGRNVAKGTNVANGRQPHWPWQMAAFVRDEVIRSISGTLPNDHANGAIHYWSHRPEMWFIGQCLNEIRKFKADFHFKFISNVIRF